jgi:thioester reductase-like protein
MSRAPAVLLTGATGFLGRYLLRDLLACGRRVAVLVRDSADRPAAARIDRLLPAGLPRPVVIAGDLTLGGLGLDGGDRRWLARHCRAVLHAAASLSFRATPDGEPWATNVRGTEALLRLARAVGMAEWHHVSTVFVCGRRPGLVSEEGADGGHGFRNAYEQSKCEAERRARAADGMRVTIYRPSVIVGDYRTGYTSSYTGLYRFFELAARLAGARRRLPLRLPLSGDEPVNLVTVDWVSRAIVALMRRPAWHGRTFHLVSRSPTPSRLIHEVAAEELGLDDVSLVGAGGAVDPTPLEAMFFEGLQEYWPYLGGSPEFCDQSTATALPDLPPPPVDEPVLRRLIRFAVARRWGRHRAPIAEPDAAVNSAWARYIETTFPRQARRSGLARAVGLDIVVGFDVRGPGGGQWSCRWERGEFRYVRRGLEEGAAVVYHTSPATFEAVIAGRQSPQQAFFEQQVAITGDLELALKLAVLLEQFLRENPPPAARPMEAIDAIPP